MSVHILLLRSCLTPSSSCVLILLGIVCFAALMTMLASVIGHRQYSQIRLSKDAPISSDRPVAFNTVVPECESHLISAER